MFFQIPFSDRRSNGREGTYRQQKEEQGDFSVASKLRGMGHTFVGRYHMLGAAGVSLYLGDAHTRQCGTSGRC